MSVAHPPLPADSPDSMRSDARPSRAVGSVLAVVALGVLLRLLWLWSWPPIGLTGDEQDYVDLARHWAKSGEFTNLGRAPGYVWFLGPIFRWTDGSLRAAQYAQIALSGICIAFVYALGRRAFERRVALLAAIAFAIDPTLIAYSHYLFNEVLYIALLLAAFWALLSKRIGGHVVAGLLLGIAALVKGITLPHVTAVLSWMWWSVRKTPGGWRAKGRPMSLFGIAMLLSLFPYTWSVYQRTGRFVLVDVSAARTLWHANRLAYEPGYDWRITAQRARDAERRYGTRQPSLQRETPESASAMMSQEIGFIRDNSALVLGRVPEKWAALFNPTNFLQRRIARGQVEGLSRESAMGRAVGVASAIIYAITMVLAVFGLWHARPSSLRGLTLASLAVYLAVFALMVSLSRYRLPLMPLLFFFAADAAMHSRRCFCPKSWRTWAAVACVALLVVSWYPYRDYALLGVDEPPRLSAR